MSLVYRWVPVSSRLLAAKQVHNEVCEWVALRDIYISEVSVSDSEQKQGPHTGPSSDEPPVLLWSSGTGFTLLSSPDTFQKGTRFHFSNLFIGKMKNMYKLAGSQANVKGTSYEHRRIDIKIITSVPPSGRKCATMRKAGYPGSWEHCNSTTAVSRPPSVPIWKKSLVFHKLHSLNNILHTPF